MSIFPQGLHIKEECPIFQEKKENTEVLIGPGSSFGNIAQEENGIYPNKSKLNEYKIKVEKNTNCTEGQSMKFEDQLCPVVLIERNLSLDQAVKEDITIELKSKTSEHCCIEKLEKMCGTDLAEEHKEKVCEESASPTLTMFVCPECNRCYTGQSDLNGHKCGGIRNDAEMVKLRNCKVKRKCKSDFVKSDICEKGQTDFVFQCTECNKPFKSKGELKSHLITHSEEMGYSCAQCNKLFKRRSGIQYHVKYCHGEEEEANSKMYKCSICLKAFGNKRLLKTHITLRHTRTRSLTCSECGDTFRDRACLKIHTLTHTGLKPYSCTYCDKAFKQLPHLRRHERIHTGTNPYLCKICGKSFRDTSNFKVHQILHSGQRPFKCDECGKTFTQRSHLNTHKQTHSDERPYVCNVCGESFKQRMILTSHLFLHSKVKPFNCDECGRSFAQITAFKRHKCYY